MLTLFRSERTTIHNQGNKTNPGFDNADQGTPYHNIQHSGSYGTLLLVLALSRVASEIINTFAWDKANYLWSLCLLPLIGLVFWPLLSMLTRHKGKLLARFLPVLAYLSFLLVRTPFSNFYSMKCLFSELIVWFCFIFTAEVCSRNFSAAEKLRATVLWSVKIILLIAVGQLLLAFASAGSLSPSVVLDFRPVQGIFVHPSIYLIVTLPFLFFFIKQRSYFWLFLTILTCVGTGTRSPFLATLCMSILVFKSACRKQIKPIDIAITLLILTVAYSILINSNSYGWEYENVDSRMTFGTLQWRVDYWRNLLADNDFFSVSLGHGLGSADLFGSGPLSESPIVFPHNDYLRVYYDIGLIGLVILLNLQFFMLRFIMRSITKDNDFIILMYLLIICFGVTDNFLFATHSVWLYMFIATFLTSPFSSLKNSL